MGLLTKLARAVFAGYNIDGSPRRIDPADAARWGTEIEMLANMSFASSRIYATKAQLNADLSPGPNSGAIVTNDPVPANNGIYAKVGASGSGSWTQLTNYNPFDQVVTAGQSGGTANAIIASADRPVAANGAQLIILRVNAANTTSPVTVDLGFGPLTVKTANGNDIEPGGLTPAPKLGFVSGTEFRLLSDVAPESLMAATEAAMIAAQQARDAASGFSAMLSADRVKFPTVQSIKDDTTMSLVAAPGKILMAVDNIVEAGEYRYRVAASSATDHDLVTADGVKLYYTNATLDPVGFGCVPGTAADQSIPFQRMLDNGATDIYLSANIRIDQVVTCRHDVRLTGPGKLDFSHGAGQLVIEGDLFELPKLSAGVVRGDNTLTWASAPDLLPGDVVIVWNPTDYSFSTARSYYRDGGAFRVHSVTGASALSWDNAVDPYVAANMRVFRLRGPKVQIDGARFIPPSAGANNAALKISKCVDVHIAGVMLDAGGRYAGIQIDRCYNVHVDVGSVINTSAAGGTDYGIVVNNSTHVKIAAGAAMSTRHGVALGGSDFEASIPTRWVNVFGGDLRSIDVFAADAHGNCDFVTYYNCTMTGFGQGGRNIRAAGCIIEALQKNAAQPCVYMIGAEVVGGYFDFVDCRFRQAKQTTTANHGVILFSSIAPKERTSINILGCVLETPLAVASMVAVKVTQTAGSAAIPVNVKIDNFGWIAPSVTGLSVLLLQGAATLASEYCVVDNIIAPAGTQLYYAHATNAAVPLRLMRQSGKIAFKTANSSNAPAPAQTFRYPYPRLPAASLANVSVGAVSYLTAGQVATPKVYGLTATSITPALVAPANFTADVDVALYWSAEIREF